jgi:hypothetical protein
MKYLSGVYGTNTEIGTPPPMTNSYVSTALSQIAPPTTNEKPPTNANGSKIYVEFNLRWTAYQWMGKNQLVNTITSDAAPVVSKVMCHNLSDGLTYSSVDYTPGGVRVVYAIDRVNATGNQAQENPYLMGTEGVFGNVCPVSTLKFNLFSKRPDTMVNLVAKKDCAVSPVPFARPNDLHMFLCAGWMGIAELGDCLRGDVDNNKPPVVKEFGHNFASQGIQLQISDAVVHIDGVHCTSRAHIEEIMKTAISNGTMRESMMPTMESRSHIFATNMQLLGANITQCSNVRMNSIGNMMQQPLSLSLQQSEVVPLHLMSDLYKSNFASICPEMASHFTAHAFNISGITPEDADNGVMLHNTYARTRHLTSRQALRMLHTIYQTPTFSSELSPYTADIILDISDETIGDLRAGTFKGSWLGRDTSDTECIDSAFSAPNDLTSFRSNDCEGSAAMMIAMQHNMRAVFHNAVSLLTNAHTEEGKQAISNWLESNTGCNIAIPVMQQHAHLVQLAALSAVAHMCVDLKLAVVGAQCATPLMSAVELGSLKEAGHCCCMMQANETGIQGVLDQVYSHWNSARYTGVNLNLPHDTGLTSAGKLSSIFGKVKPAGVTLNKPTKTAANLLSQDDIRHGYGALWSSIDSHYPHRDLSTNSFYIVESTTAMHMCPLRGYVATAQMQALVKNKHNMCSTDKNVPSHVPLEMFFKQLQVEPIQKYLKFGEDVRLQGFMHSSMDTHPTGSTPPQLPEFYKTFYQMDGLMLSEISPDGSLLIGADAVKMLNCANHASTRIVAEMTTMPLLSDSENTQLLQDTYAQWGESRAPTVGVDFMRQTLSTWHPAATCSTHAPEDTARGVMRCNISIAGETANAMYNDMKTGSAWAMDVAANTHGVVCDTKVIRMATNTTVLSQGVRVKHLMVDSAHNVSITVNTSNAVHVDVN